MEEYNAYMPIYLRISLCMLIAREKKRNERGKKSAGERIGKCLQLPAAAVVSLRFHCGKRWPRRCRPLATSRMTTRVKSILSVCRHRVPLSGNASLWYCTPCTRISYLAQSPHASPNSRNDATCHRFFCNYDMHWDIDAPPPSNVQSANYDCCVNSLMRSKRCNTKIIFIDINLIRLELNKRKFARVFLWWMS